MATLISAKTAQNLTSAITEKKTLKKFVLMIALAAIGKVRNIYKVIESLFLKNTVHIRAFTTP